MPASPDLHLELTPEGFVIAAHVGRREARVHVAVRSHAAAPQPDARFADARWGLQRTLAERAGHRMTLANELFEDLERWALGALEDHEDSWSDGLDAFSPAAARAWSIFRGRLEAATRSLARHHDGPAFRLARSFNPEVRAFVLSELRDDPTGRKAQLARACPGALVAASLPWNPAVPDLRRAAWALVGRGAALDDVLDVLRHVVQYAPAERDVAVRQRLLLRRASGLVSQLDLYEALRHLATTPLVPEDIPRDPVENARWFAVRTACHGVEDDASAAVADLASRCPRVFAAEARRSVPPDELPTALAVRNAVTTVRDDLVLYARQTRRLPGRRTVAHRWVRDARRWVDQEWNGGSPAAKIARLLERLRTLDLGEVASIELLVDVPRLHDIAGDLSFPAFRVEAPPVEGLAVRQVGSARALHEEGIRMRHCVAGLLPDVLAGRVRVLSAVARGAPLTLAVEATGDGRLRLLEARGLDDRLPSSRERELLDRWIAGAARV